MSEWWRDSKRHLEVIAFAKGRYLVILLKSIERILQPIQLNFIKAGLELISDEIEWIEIWSQLLTSTTRREWMVDEKRSMPSSESRSQHERWSDSNFFRWVKDWIPEFVILLHAVRFNFFNPGHPFARAARPISVTWPRPAREIDVRYLEWVPNSMRVWSVTLLQ